MGSVGSRIGPKWSNTGFAGTLYWESLSWFGVDTLNLGTSTRTSV